MDIQYQKFRSLTLRQIAYVLAAADHGSVSAAARWLNVSQPSVSAAIAALERHYGMPLFTRQPTQGVTLTPFGIKVMAEARLLCDQAQTVAALATPDAKIAGDVSLCCYEGIAPFVLPRLLRWLQRRLPDVSIRFFEVDLEGAVSALSQGRADLAITYDLGLGGDLTGSTLYSLQPQILCPEGHPFAKRRFVGLVELDGENLILLDQPLSAQYVMGLLSASAAVPVIVARVRNIELQRSLVANGFGVALTHTVPPTATASDGKRVINVPISDDLAEQRVLVACHRQSENRPILQAVRSEMSAAFSEGQS